MKYCSKCGKELPETAFVCDVCGTPVQPAAPVVKESSGMATAALVLSILGFLTGFLGIGIVLDIIAILLAGLTLKKAKTQPIKTGSATAGLIISGISLVLCALIIMPGMFSSPQKELLAEAESAYEAGSYIGAIAKAEQILEEYPDTKQAEKAEALLADSRSAQAEVLLTEAQAAIDGEDWSAAVSKCEALQEDYSDTEAAGKVGPLLEQAAAGKLEDQLDDLAEDVRAAHAEEKWEEVLTASSKLLRMAPESAQATEIAAMRQEAREHFEAVAVVADVYGDLFTFRAQAKILNENFPEDEQCKNLLTTARDKIREAGKAALEGTYTKRDDIQGITWIYPANAPEYVNERSASYAYIGQRDNGSEYLRWKNIYFEDDWVFFEKMIINADGQNYTLVQGQHYARDEYSRDNRSGVVWEVLDMEVEEEGTLEWELLRLIARSENVTIRFQGDQYYYDLKLSQKDKESIGDMLYAYEYLQSVGTAYGK